MTKMLEFKVQGCVHYGMYSILGVLDHPPDNDRNNQVWCPGTQEHILCSIQTLAKLLYTRCFRYDRWLCGQERRHYKHTLHGSVRRQALPVLLTIFAEGKPNTHFPRSTGCDPEKRCGRCLERVLLLRSSRAWKGSNVSSPLLVVVKRDYRLF